MVDLTKQDSPQGPVFEITEKGRQYLLSISKWMKFFYVIGIIGVVIFALLAILYMAIPYEMLDGDLDGIGPIVGSIFLVFDAFFAYLIYCLGKSAQFIKTSLPGKDSLRLEAGFEYLKKALKSYGIFVIAVLALYVLIIVVAIIAASLL